MSLVGTLLVLSITTPEDESDVAPSESVESTAIDLQTGSGPSVGQSLSGQYAMTTSQNSVGQSLLGRNASTSSLNDDPEDLVDFEEDPADVEEKADAPPSRADTIWKRYLLGIDKTEEPQPQKARTPSPPPTEDSPSALFVPWHAGQLVFKEASLTDRSDAPESIAAALDRAILAAPRYGASSSYEKAGSTDVAGVARVTPDFTNPNGVSLSATSEPRKKSESKSLSRWFLLLPERAGSSHRSDTEMCRRLNRS